MLYYIDIDGTIAKNDRLSQVRAINDHFALNVDADRLSRLRYSELLQQPETLECRVHLGNAEFDRQLSWVDYRDDVLRACLPLPGAVEGVRRFADIGEVRYLTCRTPDMLDTTREWLHTWGFPDGKILSAHVVMNKWIKLYTAVSEQSERAVLVDDCYEQLLIELEKLQCGDHPKLSPQRCQEIVQALQLSCSLVAFGAKEPVIHSGLSVVPLPSWQDISSLKGGIYGNTVARTSEV